MPGRLLLVATPIGNLEDLSPRAVAALARADRIACEDTRHSGRLLHHLGIKKPLLSLHEHNERRRLPEILAALEAGETIAVVSDAGTPLLSDPGFPLVRAAAEAGHRIEAIPGPSAILTALVASGLPPYPFTFAGFAPPKSGKRRTFYKKLGELGHTVVIFESPHRIAPSLADAVTELGPDRPAAVARELTKLHEEILRGPLGELATALAERKPLGEYVLVLGAAGAARERQDRDEDKDEDQGKDKELR